MNDFFIDRFKNKPTPELLHIIENPEGFQSKAVEAAKFIVEKRNQGAQDFQVKKPEYLVKSDFNILSKLNTSIKSIAVYQIVSGLLILPYFYNNNYDSVFDVLITFLFLVIYVIGIYGGIYILKKNDKGLYLSKIFNAFQTFILSLNGIFYSCTGLFTLYIQLKFLNGINLSLGFNYGSKASLYFGNPDGISIGLNIVSLFALILLIEAHKTLKESNLFNDILLNRKFTDL